MADWTDDQRAWGSAFALAMDEPMVPPTELSKADQLALFQKVNVKPHPRVTKGGKLVVVKGHQAKRAKASEAPPVPRGPTHDPTMQPTHYYWPFNRSTPRPGIKVVDGVGMIDLETGKLVKSYKEAREVKGEKSITATSEMVPMAWDHMRSTGNHFGGTDSYMVRHAETGQPMAIVSHKIGVDAQGVPYRVRLPDGSHEWHFPTLEKADEFMATAYFERNVKSDLELVDVAVRSLSTMNTPKAGHRDQVLGLRAVTLWTNGNVKSVRDPQAYNPKEAAASLKGVALPGETFQNTEGMYGAERAFFTPPPTELDYKFAHEVMRRLAQKPQDADTPDTVWRGMSLSEPVQNELIEGAEFDMGTVASWATEERSATLFGKGKDGLVFKIHRPRGAKIAHLSPYPEEHEFVTGGKMRVVGRARGPNGLMITVEHIAA